jgi:ribosomal-protein-serine acetyltransferase
MPSLSRLLRRRQRHSRYGPRQATVPGACAGWSISEDCRLRLLEEDDAPELHALISANRARLAKWLSWAATQTPEDTIEFIRGTRKQLADNDGFQTAIVCGDAIAGVVGYIGVDWRNRSTGLGYWLGAEYEGRGTMTLAVGALVDHALSGWHLNRVEIRAAEGNLPSRAIPERLGFRQDGILREAELVEGRHLDSVVYSMLAADWPSA